MLEETFESIFKAQPEVVAAAPGRLEFVGNHTDYNGGRVIGVAIDRGVTIAASKRDDDSIVIHSAAFDASVTVDLSIEKPLGGDDTWANYPLGVYCVMKQRGFAFKSGFNFVIESDLPFGAGLSSSAAFELATVNALDALFGFSIDTKTSAQIARQAENEFVGVPCGILDQGVSAFGKKDHLVLIDCKDESFRQGPMPAGIHFWVFNTEKKHALIDSFYEARNKECHDAFDVLEAKHPELTCLSDATVEQLEALKSEMDETLYKRASHVLNENRRVDATEKALQEGDLKTAGEMLFASHESSRHLFENSCEELDVLVDLLKGKPGVLGARLTGGGFGGAVMAVTDASYSEASAQEIIEGYEKQVGHKPTLFHMQTGDGARIVKK